MIRVTQDPLDAAALLQDFSRDRLDTGAVVSFTVRSPATCTS